MEEPYEKGYEEQEIGYNELERRILELAAALEAGEILRVHELMDDEFSDYTLEELVYRCEELEELGFIEGGPIPGPPEIEQSYEIDCITHHGENRLTALT